MPVTPISEVLDMMADFDIAEAMSCCLRFSTLASPILEALGKLVSGLLRPLECIANKSAQSLITIPVTQLIPIQVCSRNAVDHHAVVVVDGENLQVRSSRVNTCIHFQS